MYTNALTAKPLQSCPTLCDPIDSSPPGSAVPGILQARIAEWVAISFFTAGKWKVKVKSLSCLRLLATSWTAAHLAPPSMRFSRQEYWSGVPLPSLVFSLVFPINSKSHIFSTNCSSKTLGIVLDACIPIWFTSKLDWFYLKHVSWIICFSVFSMLTVYFDQPLSLTWFIGFPFHSCLVLMHLLHNNQKYLLKS